MGGRFEKKVWKEIMEMNLCADVWVWEEFILRKCRMNTVYKNKL